MPTTQMDPQSFLPLPPASFHILMVLAKRENHGYGIMRAIDENTNGRYRIGPGTLYGSIKRMLKAGWIEEIQHDPDGATEDERRRYYRLTDLGIRISRAEADRLAQMVDLARDARLLGSSALALLVAGPEGR